ncbi:MAG: metallophosphoesterase [Patescibacteria group bacterium]|jgi:calcineurin-like phosphoesterase family protein
MTYWATADFHLGHFNIIKYVNRPFKTLEEMNETIIHNHNQRVKKNDVWIHNGDFIFNSANNKGNGSIFKAAEFLDRFNGTPILILGNHDARRGNSVKTKNQSLILSGPGYQIKVVHNPLHADPSFPLNLIGHVHTLFKILSFKEYYEWQKKVLLRTDLPESYYKTVKQFVERWKNHKKDSVLLNIGVDVHNFFPLSFEEIICLYNKFKKQN